MRGDVYQYDDGDGTSEAPDELVIDGDPAEVGVTVSLWVQAHCQTCSQQGGKQHLVIHGLLFTFYEGFIFVYARLDCEPGSSWPGPYQYLISNKYIK